MEYYYSIINILLDKIEGVYKPIRQTESLKRIPVIVCFQDPPFDIE